MKHTGPPSHPSEVKKYRKHLTDKSVLLKSSLLHSPGFRFTEERLEMG